VESQESMFSAGDFPAKTSRWRASVADYLATGAGSFSSSCASLQRQLPYGFSSRTSLDFCRRTKDGTWAPSSGRWQTSGMGGPTACLTLSTSIEPLAARVRSMVERLMLLSSLGPENAPRLVHNGLLQDYVIVAERVKLRALDMAKLVSLTDIVRRKLLGYGALGDER
jgi:hypothetical protein